MRGHQFAVLIAALLGVLAHLSLVIDYLGWDELVNYFLKSPVMTVLFYVLWGVLPYVVLFALHLAFKSLYALKTLTILIIALACLDAWWYASHNSRDWYLFLSPVMLTPIAGLFFLFALGAARLDPARAPNPPPHPDVREASSSAGKDGAHAGERER